MVRSSQCGTMGLVVSWEYWDTGWIPSQVQWLKDPVLPQLQPGWQVWLESDSWPRNSICCGTAKKEKKNVAPGGVPLWKNWLSIHQRGLGCCCGAGSIPGIGNSMGTAKKTCSYRKILWHKRLIFLFFLLSFKGRSCGNGGSQVGVKLEL